MATNHRHTRTSRLTAVLVAAAVVLSVFAAATPAAAADTDGTDGVQVLDDDEHLYLVFGADVGNQSIAEYVEENNPTDDDPSAGDVVQYSDVTQVNVDVEGEASSVSIDGGQAVALRDASQQNANSQTGEATAERHTAESYEAGFENVGDVYLVFGDGGGDSFDGWAVVDGDGEVSQSAEATVGQSQTVGQANVNERTTALAFAENDSSATAIQQTRQSNRNLQEASAEATTVVDDRLDDGEKRAYGERKKGPDGPEATVEQDQEVEQLNVNEEAAAVAVAVGEGSTATAIQLTDQSNLNEQVGFAEAVEIMLEDAGMNVAAAGPGAADAVDRTGDGEVKSDPKGDHSPETTEATVSQVQGVEQVNFNSESSAEAVATDGGDATAIQLTYQQNRNAQIGSAVAVDAFEEVFPEPGEKKVDHGDGPHHEHVAYESVHYTNSTSLVLDGDGVADADHVAVDYDGASQHAEADQYTTAELEQFQQVTQLNENSQSAIAVAEGGSASALQVTLQENENVQLAAIESVSITEIPRDPATIPTVTVADDTPSDVATVTVADDAPDEEKKTAEDTPRDTAIVTVAD